MLGKLFCLHLVLLSLNATQTFLPQETLQAKSEGKVYRFPLKTKKSFSNNEADLFEFLSLSQKSIDDISLLETAGGSTEKIHLNNFKNLQYTAEISIGNSYDTFKVVLDTGSANMWIDSTRCREDGCEKHHQYDAASSHTFVQEGFDLSVEFGTGALKGQINSDNLYFGDLELPAQSFAEIVEENGIIFRDMDFDGILGLAYPQMADSNIIPVFDNLMNQRKLEKNMFGFYFQREDESMKKSEFTLGGYNADLIEGDVHWHKVVDKYYWSLEAQNILIGGKDIGLCDRGCRVLADTGTSIMTAPFDDLSKLLKVLKVKDHCKQMDQLPDITYVLDGINYTLTPEEYVKQTNPDQQSLSQLKKDQDMEIFIETSNWDCIASYMPMDIQEPQGPAWILGDIFLTKYYSIYDRDNNSVGFGKAKH